MDKSIYLFFGDDELPVQAAARKAIEALLPEADRAFGLEVVEARSDDSAMAIRALTACRQSLQSGGLFSGRKVVWLRGVDFLADGGLSYKRSKDLLEEIQDFARWIEAGIPGEAGLVITATHMDKRQVFYKVVAARGAVQEFSLPDKAGEAETDARARTHALLKQAGLRMDEDAMEVFLARVGGQTRQIAGELEKLTLYLGKRREANAEDVKAIVSPSREALIWDLTDAVARRELPRALSIVRQLLFQKESAVGIAIQLANRFRDLTLFREALDQGWAACQSRGRFTQVLWKNPPTAVAQLFEEVPALDPRKMNPWRAGFLAGQAQQFTAADLARCRGILAEMHMKIVSSGRVPDDVLIETAILRLIGARQQAVRQPG